MSRMLRLGQLHFVVAHAVHLDALVVVVDRDGELLLGLVLADHVVVEKALHLLRLGQVAGGGGGMRLRRGRPRESSCRRPRTRRRCRREGSRWATRSAWPRRPATCGRTSSAVLLRVPCAFSCYCSLIGLARRSHDPAVTAAYVRGRSMISSTMPYSLACCAFMMKSRSTSRSMRSSGWPVCLAISVLVISRMRRISRA